jgi:type III secretory pathway component EscR
MTIETGIKDILFTISKSFKYSKLEMAARKGHHLHVTSIVVDLFKE